MILHLSIGIILIKNPYFYIPEDIDMSSEEYWELYDNHIRTKEEYDWFEKKEFLDRFKDTHIYWRNTIYISY